MIEIESNMDELALALALEPRPEHIKAFLRALCTPAEITDLAKRWALVKALRKKVPQRQIAKNLQISLCKITRGSRELKKTDSAFLRMFELINGQSSVE